MVQTFYFLLLIILITESGPTFKELMIPVHLTVWQKWCLLPHLREFWEIPACTYFLLLFFEVEISSSILIPLCMPGSVHSCSARWRKCFNLITLFCLGNTKSTHLPWPGPSNFQPLVYLLGLSGKDFCTYFSTIWCESTEMITLLAGCIYMGNKTNKKKKNKKSNSL